MSTVPGEREDESAPEEPKVELTEAQEIRLAWFDWLIEACEAELQRRRTLRESKQ